MSKMVSKQTLFLVQQQASFGTAETDLDTNDLIETIGPATFTLDAGVTEVDHVSGSLDQDAAIPGACSYEVAAKVYMRTGGVAQNFGQVDRLLLGSEMVGVTAGNIKTYSFGSTRSAYVDDTAWGYSGDKSTAGALLRKASNIVWKPKWTFETGKPVVMDISGTGVFGGPASTGTQPSITKLRKNPPAFVGATTLKINGDTDYKVLKAEIDPGQATDLTLDASAAYGRGKAAITDRKIKWAATVYQDVPGTVDPETALLGKTEGALWFAYGTAPQKITFSCGYAQITNLKEGDENGVQVWNLSGQANRNDFSIAMDTTT